MVGAGTGATVAKWRGFEHMQPGGIGSAVRRVGDATVGALVVVNAVGDVFTLSGEPLTGGPHEPGPPVTSPEPMTNTTLVVVATDFLMTRNELTRLAVRSHDALAACIRPVHTRFDGDIAYAVSCGSVRCDVEAAAEAAFGATASAVELAVRASMP
jgi:L-aminopeptidase/D-esterase-like protein